MKLPWCVGLKCMSVALAFLNEGGIRSLVIDGLEFHESGSLPLTDGTVVGLDEVAEVIRGLLREEFRCRLESDAGFVHIERDCYMYVGVSRLCSASLAKARQMGLFVEEFRSPQGRRRDA